jgi:hypothetical protein
MAYSNFLSFIFLISLCSCGEENFSGGSRVMEPPQEEVQIAPPPEEFRTRLSNTLLIEGDRCRGDETTEPYGNGAICNAGQYLIYVDNVNTCNGAGQCSDFVVIPIVGELDNIDAETSGTSIFDIIPMSTVSNTVREILLGVAVETDLNGNGTVFFK